MHSCLYPSKLKNVHEFRKRQAVPCLFELVKKFIWILRWPRADVNQLNTQLKINIYCPQLLVNQFILISLARYFLLQSTSQPVHPYNVSGLRAYDFLPKLTAKLFTSLLWRHMSVKNFKLRWVFSRGIVVNESPPHNRSFKTDVNLHVHLLNVLF